MNSIRHIDIDRYCSEQWTWQVSLCPSVQCPNVPHIRLWPIRCQYVAVQHFHWSLTVAYNFKTLAWNEHLGRVQIGAAYLVANKSTVHTWSSSDSTRWLSVSSVLSLWATLAWLMFPGTALVCALAQSCLILMSVVVKLLPQLVRHHLAMRPSMAEPLLTWSCLVSYLSYLSHACR